MYIFYIFHDSIILYMQYFIYFFFVLRIFVWNSQHLKLFIYIMRDALHLLKMYLMPFGNTAGKL